MTGFSLARPLLFALDAETAHRATIRAAAAWGRAGAPMAPRRPRDPVTIAGLKFPNRVGLAAGVDKDAEAIDGFLAMGFGAVEVGTLTPLAQPGNPKPRLFRLAEDGAVINRMGFNNGGIDAALARIARARRSGVVGINVGANKDSADRVADYALGVGKAMAESLMRYFVTELAPRGIRINAVAPGLVATTSVAGMVGGEEAATRVFERAARSNPSGRMSQDSDYASVVAFLLSPAAEFVQGQVIHANGGAYVAG